METVKGYSLVGIVMGSYPDEEIFDQYASFSRSREALFPDELRLLAAFEARIDLITSGVDVEMNRLRTALALTLRGWIPV